MEITDGRRGDGHEERIPHTDAADAAFSAIPCACGQEASVRTIREVSTYLIEMGQIPLAKIPKVLADVDVNGDGMISLDEWRNSFAELGLGGGDAMHNLEPNIVTVPFAPSLPLSVASYIVVKESTGPIGLSLASHERQHKHDRLQASYNHPIEVKPNAPAARSVPPLAEGMRIVGINGILVPADEQYGVSVSSVGIQIRQACPNKASLSVSSAGSKSPPPAERPWIQIRQASPPESERPWNPFGWLYAGHISPAPGLEGTPISTLYPPPRPPGGSHGSQPLPQHARASMAPEQSEQQQQYSPPYSPPGLRVEQVNKSRAANPPRRTKPADEASPLLHTSPLLHSGAARSAGGGAVVSVRSSLLIDPTVAAAGGACLSGRGSSEVSSRHVRSSGGSGGSPGQRKLRRDPNKASVFTPREEESLAGGSPSRDRALAPEEPRRFSKQGIAAASERLLASGSCVSILHSSASTGPMVNGKGSPPSSRLIRDAWDQPVRVSSLELATALGLDLELEISEPSERGVVVGDGEPEADGSSWADASAHESGHASAPASAPSAAESRATGGADAAAEAKEKAKRGGEAEDPKRVKGKADAKERGKEAKAEEDKRKAGAPPPQSQRGREPTMTKRPLSTAPDASLLSERRGERDVKRLEQAGPRRMHIDYASFDNARRGAQASAVMGTRLGEPSGSSAGNSMRGGMAGAPTPAAAVGGGGGSGFATPKCEESPRRDTSPRDRPKKGSKDAKREAGGGKRPTTVGASR